MTKDFMIGVVFIFSLCLAGSDSDDMTVFVWKAIIALVGFAVVIMYVFIKALDIKPRI